MTNMATLDDGILHTVRYKTKIGKITMELFMVIGTIIHQTGCFTLNLATLHSVILQSTFQLVIAKISLDNNFAISFMTYSYFNICHCSIFFL